MPSAPLHHPIPTDSRAQPAGCRGSALWASVCPLDFSADALFSAIGLRLCTESEEHIGDTFLFQEKSWRKTSD